MAINPYISAELDHSNYRYPDRFRKFFGEHSNNADPMINGYGMVFFQYLPSQISNQDNKKLITALCTNFTGPGMTISTEQYGGRDGGKWAVPTVANMDSNEITLHFWELVGLPVYKLISAWVSLLRNPQYGYMTDIQWRQSQYKGKMMYCSCTPDMKVQYAKVYSGIMPLKINDDAFNGDIENQGKIEFDVTFSFDHYPYSSTDIINNAQTMVDTMLSEVDNVVSTKYADAASNA